MAVQRSRRLRKKLRLDEFQELGFTVKWSFAEGTSVEEIDRVVDDLIKEVIDPQDLAFDASGYISWEGLVCLQSIGKCTEEHRQSVDNWLKAKNLKDVETSELFDVWWE
nr:50S ribosome-binding protein YggL [uncultured Moellerella sp.]